ncbi:PREDICTED: core histone macro-H2A.1-like, partial [Acropora digitifera]|uniref:core histone macro-H2A.1-like n=1 Tax=Acropora digitifera TaxID=70779 RepID=UPI00077AEE7F
FLRHSTLPFNNSLVTNILYLSHICNNCSLKFISFIHQLLKGVTIASGGVLPNIHPELLKKRKGGKLVAPEELKSKKPKPSEGTRAGTSGKKIAAPAKKVSPVKKVPISAGKGSKKKAPAQKKGDKSGPGSGLAVLSEKTLFLGQKLTVIQGDIAAVEADALVNPTNATFHLGGEVGMCCPEFCFSVCANPAFFILLLFVEFSTLPQVIHCDEQSERLKSNTAVLNITLFYFLLLQSNNSFPKQTAAQTILKAISNYFVSVMASSLKQIYFVLHDAESIGCYTLELARLDS